MFQNLGFEQFAVARIKGCQTAGRSLREHGKRERAELKDTFSRKLACCLPMCVLAMSSGCQKTVPLPVKANDQLTPPQCSRDYVDG
jgi:hypothetical protein